LNKEISLWEIAGLILFIAVFTTSVHEGVHVIQMQNQGVEIHDICILGVQQPHDSKNILLTAGAWVTPSFKDKDNDFIKEFKEQNTVRELEAYLVQFLLTSLVFVIWIIKKSKQLPSQ